MNKRVCALFFLLCLSFGVLFVKMAELCGGEGLGGGGRLATSTLAHQEIQYPNRVLEFLFCNNLPGG